MRDIDYDTALAQREHLIALGWTRIYLYDKGVRPWDKVVRVEEGSSVRLGTPISASFIAEDHGLEFSWNENFEGYDANGRGISVFDRDQMRALMRKLPEVGRAQFAAMLRAKVLPQLSERTAEIRKALNTQQDTEDCVRGLLAFAEAPGGPKSADPSRHLDAPAPVEA